mgnify:CR=1 FL=1
MSKRVLVVDDEKLIVKGIRFSLEQEGMEVDCAYDGEEALEKAKEKEYDMILLDIMLPKLTGLEVCQQIREFSSVPIIMLTAKGEDMDKILGLEYGADDYITKPFNILEVKARIKAIMRRMRKEEAKESFGKTLVSGDLKLDCEGRRVFIAGKEINLTAKEFDVLELLAKNPNKVYSRENLLNLVWGYEYPGDVRTVDVHIRRLREKIEAAENFDADSNFAILKSIQKEYKIKGKNLYMGSRIMLTGQMHGPDIPKVMEVLGKENCLRRLDYVKANVLDKLN